MTENDASSVFWRFSLALYAQTGVKEASLTLQDARDDDVVLLYACLFAALRGAGALAPERMRALLGEAGRWQTDVTARLRAARRAAGTRSEGASLNLGDVERAAERVGHGLAAPLLGPPGRRPRAAAHDAAWANLRLYRAETGRPLGPADTALLTRLVDAALDLDDGEA